MPYLSEIRKDIEKNPSKLNLNELLKASQFIKKEYSYLSSQMMKEFFEICLKNNLLSGAYYSFDLIRIAMYENPVYGISENSKVDRLLTENPKISIRILESLGCELETDDVRSWMDFQEGAIYYKIGKYHIRITEKDGVQTFLFLLRGNYTEGKWRHEIKELTTLNRFINLYYELEDVRLRPRNITISDI